jgi:hypothetical protein
VRQFLVLLFKPGDVFEVRAPGCRLLSDTRFAFTCSGYFTFDSLDQAAREIAELDRSGMAPGIYVTLNPVDPSLLARSANRIKPRARETTQDKDIVRRQTLLIDIDPVRPAGVSATDIELANAHEAARAITEYLTTLGWPAPTIAMSGNGYHLLYRIDLPADDGGLVHRVLTVLADRFSTEAVTIDRAVHNAARITKVIGTVARKGDNLCGVPGLEDRPHRRSEFLSVPKDLAVVPDAYLLAVADVDGGPKDASGAASAAPVADWNERFDCTPSGVRAWLEAHGVPVKGERRNGDKTLLLLERCPINPEIVSTGNSDITVLVGDDGKLSYCNKHNRGQGYTWHDLRRALDPGYEPPPKEGNDVDLSGFMPTTRVAVDEGSEDRDIEQLPDPGPTPVELLRIPGFISEVMDHCLQTAPYPSQVLAFCGALAMQAFLAGRKVRDSGDNRTNIYLLGLAHSSAGKDWPRKINTQIANEVGLAGCLGERFASGEGIQDALFVSPSMLFQTDEIDGILQSINKAKDARHENIMSTLLTMYSSANSVFPMRRKAGKESPGVIDQPNLVILGTAIPNHYYQALSERMLTNGFFARMVILECGKRSPGQEPRIEPLPARVLETARWWADFQPGKGNLEHWHPIPKIVPHTDQARDVLIETRLEAEAEYAKAEAAGDPVGTTVWGRVSEHARKLALLYAISENHENPEIGKAAAEWARRFIVHQIRRMLFMVASHVADNEFDADCLKVINKLRAAPDLTLSHSKLLKRMKRKSTEMDEIMKTLILRGDVEPVVDQRIGPGPKAVSYRLRVKRSVEE